MKSNEEKAIAYANENFPVSDDKSKIYNGIAAKAYLDALNADRWVTDLDDLPDGQYWAKISVAGGCCLGVIERFLGNWMLDDHAYNDNETYDPQILKVFPLPKS